MSTITLNDSTQKSILTQDLNNNNDDGDLDEDVEQEEDSNRHHHQQNQHYNRSTKKTGIEWIDSNPFEEKSNRQQSKQNDCKKSMQRKSLSSVTIDCQKKKKKNQDGSVMMIDDEENDFDRNGKDLMPIEIGRNQNFLNDFIWNDCDHFEQNHFYRNVSFLSTDIEDNFNDDCDDFDDFNTTRNLIHSTVKTKTNQKSQSKAIQFENYRFFKTKKSSTLFDDNHRHQNNDDHDDGDVDRNLINGRKISKISKRKISKTKSIQDDDPFEFGNQSPIDSLPKITQPRMVEKKTSKPLEDETKKLKCSKLKASKKRK